MKILAIETSCDETAVAVLLATGTMVKPTFEVLGNSLLSQVDIHKEFGGVVPMLAKREHEKNLPVLLEKTLLEANITNPEKELDAIAVTSGPGLEPALWAGIVFANELGSKWGKRVVAVNHMEGHILSVLYKLEEEVEFPALALLVSGGHTELVLVEAWGKYTILGRTLDDAVGEAFDKAARLLGLPYPGGPEISKLAQEHRALGLKPTFLLPRPMIHSKDFNFSYSGLKTAVLYKLKEFPDLTPEIKSEVAHAFEDAAVEVLISKTRDALGKYNVKSLIVGGGVSANKYLRSELVNLISEFNEVNLYIPSMPLTTDNAIMIGMAAYRTLTEVFSLNKKPEALKASGNLSL